MMNYNGAANSFAIYQNRISRSGFYLIVVWCLMTCACANNTSNSTLTVSGKVYLGDKPVEAGLVTFLSEDGRIASAELGPGGQFTMKNAPTGKVYIGVDTQMVEGEKQNLLHRSKGKEVLRYVGVPLRYANPKTSGLTEELIEAGKTINLRLKP